MFGVVVGLGVVCVMGVVLGVVVGVVLGIFV